MKVTQAQYDTLWEKAKRFNIPRILTDLEIVLDDDIPNGSYVGFWNPPADAPKKTGVYYGIEKDGYCHT